MHTCINFRPPQKIESTSTAFLLSVVVSLAFTYASDFGHVDKASPTSTNVAELLPEDTDTWEMIRRQGKVYVDKTNTLEYILDKTPTRNSELKLFARPYGFGKSIFVQMMQRFFLGEKSLFKGTSIYKRGNMAVGPSNGKWITYPVINLDFKDLRPNISRNRDQEIKQFDVQLQRKLQLTAKSYNISVTEPYFDIGLLIPQLRHKFNSNVIILVDNFDASIIHVDDKDLVNNLTNVLVQFLVQIKANIKCIDLAWVNGVTRLGFDPVIGVANGFTDMSNHQQLGAAMGFTEKEILSNFKSHLETLGKKLQHEDVMEILMKAYGGYRFTTEEEIRVFNPTSVIKCLQNQQIEIYWNPPESLDRITKYFYEDVCRNIMYQKIGTDSIMLQIKYFKPICYMFWTGYFTIDSYRVIGWTDSCKLTCANNEIKTIICNSIRHYIPSEKKMMSEVDWLSSNLR